VENALKLAHIEMYQERLKDRERRRQAARDFSLVRQFFRDGGSSSSSALLAAHRLPAAHIKPAAKRSKSELTDRLKTTARFQPSAEEHSRFLASMLRERELKARIKELNRYRKNGVHGHREAEQFEVERVRRNKEKADRKRAQEAGGGGGVDGPSSSSPRKENSQPSGAPDLDSLSSVVGLPGNSNVDVEWFACTWRQNYEPNYRCCIKFCYRFLLMDVDGWSLVLYRSVFLAISWIEPLLQPRIHN
jgi:hypothetical protein